MGIYDIIYDFLINNIFNSTYLANYETSIMGVTTDLNVWLAHSVTIVIMLFFVFCLYLFTKFLFNVVSKIFMLR